ncbi:response regulator [Alteromonas sediminis]|uniref:histidine kinase n=1 Tax=Alteromonas sediminis TaxID=2259342 RepID=A0A3N5YLJ6_9ALTE|nr:response regulator [Alteromonas sediminis]RPJ66031.1 response regulator [Alteromonas sediminis]
MSNTKSTINAHHYQTLAIVAVSALIALLFIYEQSRAQQSLYYPTIINIAGKQRMLSQRISYLQHLVVTDGKSHYVRQWQSEMTRLIKEFDSSHKRLSAQLPFSEAFTLRLPAPVRSAYFDGASSVDVLVREFIQINQQTATSTENSYTFYTPAQSANLLFKLDEVVALFEQASVEQRRKEQIVDYIIWFLLMCLIALVLRSTFKPLKARVSAQEASQQETETALAAAKASADINEKQRNLYVAKLTHDLRSPISAIISILELLPNSRGESKTLIRHAEEACFRLLKYSDALSDIIKDRADYGSRRDFDLIALLDDVIAKAVNAAELKGLVFHMHCEDELPGEVIGYPQAMKKSMMNVLNNAVKYTEKGSITLTLSISQEAEQVFLTVSVTDTGVGIDEQYHQAIFKRFTQLFDTQANTYFTTGVGLAIAKECIDGIGGEISVKSALEQGATFNLRFPLQKVSTEGIQGRSVNEEVKFAVIDDLAISRQHLQKLVRSAGFSCDLYDSSTNFFDNKDRISSYTGLIVDYYMPGLNGEELVITLSAMLGDKMPTVIMVSASPDVANIVSNGPVKPWQVFTKPIMEPRFVDALQKLAEASGEPVAQANASILVVEDEQINAEMLGHMLTSMGYKTKIAANGQTALTLCTNYTFDCILLDIHLPDIDGLEVARQLKQREYPAEIVALSGDTEESTKQAAQEAGIRYYLFKPVPFQELNNTLKLVLSMNA